MPENEGSYVVGSVTATDQDSSSANSLTYRLEYSSIYFTIDSTTGVIRTLRPLDYESVKQYNFTVEVRDGPPTPRIGRAYVIVNVLDRADSVPRFEQRSYNVDFEENKIGDLVTVKVKI